MRQLALISVTLLTLKVSVKVDDLLEASGTKLRLLVRARSGFYSNLIFFRIAQPCSRCLTSIVDTQTSLTFRKLPELIDRFILSIDFV